MSRVHALRGFIRSRGFVRHDRKNINSTRVSSVCLCKSYIRHLPHGCSGDVLGGPVWGVYHMDLPSQRSIQGKARARVRGIAHSRMRPAVLSPHKQLRLRLVRPLGYPLRHTPNLQGALNPKIGCTVCFGHLACPAMRSRARERRPLKSVRTPLRHSMDLCQCCVGV